MKFIVEFHFKPGTKEKAMDLFELRGPNRNPGVSFRNAWIGTRSDIAFVLLESDYESLVEQAAQTWHDAGSYRIHPVVDVEQY
jgi:hypothetical protein